LEIARGLCAGFARAHETGVPHRDLKPANVMPDGRGQVLLTGFGLAGLAREIEGSWRRYLLISPRYVGGHQSTGFLR
jgi:serine/threonine-protein kinase